jgi:hypothetical protein
MAAKYPKIPLGVNQRQVLSLALANSFPLIFSYEN